MLGKGDNNKNKIDIVNAKDDISQNKCEKSDQKEAISKRNSCRKINFTNKKSNRSKENLKLDSKNLEKSDSKNLSE